MVKKREEKKYRQKIPINKEEKKEAVRKLNLYYLPSKFYLGGYFIDLMYHLNILSQQQSYVKLAYSRAEII